jgi:hypothetical protein
MSKPVLALFLCVPAVVGWAIPVQAAAADPVLLDVDVDELPESDQVVGPVILEHFGRLVEDAGFEVTDASEGATVLRIRLRRLEAGDRNYGIHFEFVDGGAVEPAIDWVDCVFCTEARMLQKLDAVAPSVLEAIEARQQASGDEGEDAGEGGEGGGVGMDGGSEPEDDGGAEPKRRPIGPLGGAGIGIAAAGLGVTIAGAVQWSRGRVPNDDLTSRISEGRDYTTQGQVLVGIGVGALVVGAVMLGVDMGVLAKRRSGEARARISPTIGPERAGLVVQGRF